MSDTEKPQEGRPADGVKDTQERILLGDKEILLVGTAHVSPESVEEVKQVIAEEKPDRLCLELDKARYQAMTEEKGWKEMNIYQVIREKKVFLLLANLVLNSFQKKMGAGLGLKPGMEMKAAAEAAREQDIPLSFCDREVHTTLRRAWACSGFWNKNKLLASLLASFFSNEKIDEAEIEELKKKNAVESMMQELADYMPSVKTVLIDERDRFLAAKIFQAPGKKVVAVVGAGHMKGIIAMLHELHQSEEERRQSGSAEANPALDLSDINHVPAPSRFSKILPWSIPVLILGLFVLGFVRNGTEVGFEMIKQWVLLNGTFSAIGALLALAHPITIILSFLAAPITSMNPTIGVGLVVGLFEAFIRKPRVSDFESLQEDVLSLRGFYRNRVTHILLVVLMATLGSILGTVLGASFLSVLAF